MVAMLLLAIGDFSTGVLNNVARPYSTIVLNFVAYVFFTIMSCGIYVLTQSQESSKSKLLRQAKSGFAMVEDGAGHAWYTAPAVAALTLIGNRYVWRAYGDAPSIGFAEAVYSTNSAVVLILTYLAFRTKISIVNMVGIGLSILGVGLMAEKKKKGKI